jgi:TPR repeat protein
MQKNYRRFLLPGVILIGLMALMGIIFLATDTDELANGLAHYHQKDYVEAAKWFRKAAEQGEAEAQYYLGRLYEKGQGVTEDNQQAVQWYRKAAEQGHAQAQLQLGGMYQRGAGISQDQSAALKWFFKAAEQGHAPAQDLLGMIYQLGIGVSADNQQAVDWYRKAAEQEHANAQYHLGQSYYKGQGVIKNEPEAINWLSKAAAQGQPDAQQHALAEQFVAIAPEMPNDSGTRGGRMDDQKPTEVVYQPSEPLSQPTSVPPLLNTQPNENTDKPQKTFQQYRKAAEQGEAEAQFQLGLMYERGTEVTKDEQQALKWIRKAAEQGLADAQNQLGIMYYKSVTLDDKEAIKWFRKSAEQGLAQAQFYLGMMYRLGEGVTQDEQQALEWFRKAAAQGEESAQKLLALKNGQPVTVNHQITAQLPSVPKPMVIAQTRTSTPNETTETLEQKTQPIEIPSTRAGESPIEEPPAKESDCPDNQYALTVNATPSTSRIRIMNIRPKYQPGICLTPRRYDIYVTHRDYHGYREWISLTAADMSLDVALTPK